jgi:uncharacterized protein YjcR
MIHAAILTAPDGNRDADKQSSTQDCEGNESALFHGYFNSIEVSPKPQADSIAEGLQSGPIADTQG